MTMVSTGPISLGGNATTGGLNQSVNIELGRAATATINMNDLQVRALAGAPSGAISMRNFYGKSDQFAFTISTNQTNANLRTLAVNAGWDQRAAVVATISPGVYVSSSSTGTPGLTINGVFPNGVTLINNGFIIGRGGAGGNGRRSDGTPDGTTGGAGGLALSVSVAVRIRNNETIGGGGGGGGGGGAGSYDDKGFPVGNGGGGGGGGRSGATNSVAGAGGGGLIGGASGSAGGAGTAAGAGAGGAGGSSGPATYAGATGGAGGTWGAGGGTGGTALSQYSDGTVWGQRRFGLSGGSAGGAITGNANITWLATGTRLGAIS